MISNADNEEREDDRAATRMTRDDMVRVVGNLAREAADSEAQLAQMTERVTRSEQRLAEIDLSARLVAPLAAGHHVDHQAVRAAAESLGRALFYYEDYPYAETPEKLEAVLRDGAWLAERVRLNDQAIRMKAKAINAYRSQISTFFEDAAEVEQRVRAYASRAGGEAGPAERLWRPA